MAINKAFGYIAQEYGVAQYPKVMLVPAGRLRRAAAYGMLSVCSTSASLFLESLEMRAA